MDKNTAIKRLLIFCGRRPPTANDSSAEGQVAGVYLDEANLDIQIKGWPENTETRVELTRDANNELTDAELNVGGVTTIAVRGVGESTHLGLIRRGTKLFWRDPSITTGSQWTSVFDGDPVVERIILLDFEDLSQAMADYVVMAAAGAYFDNQLKYTREDDRFGPARIRARITQRFLEAKATAEQTEAQIEMGSLLDNPWAQRIRGRRRGYSLLS